MKSKSRRVFVLVVRTKIGFEGGKNLQGVIWHPKVIGDKLLRRLVPHVENQNTFFLCCYHVKKQGNDDVGENRGSGHSDLFAVDLRVAQ